MDEVKRVVFGSGENYLKEVDGTIDTSDVDALIEQYFVPENEWGDTKNGFTLTYSPTSYTVEDDLGRTTETFLTKEQVQAQLGLVKVAQKIFKPLIETAREVTSKKENRKILKVGGLENATGKSYFLGFKHLDKKRGDIYVMLIGKNTGELSLSFNPESETILNPTFTADAMDGEGTKVIIVTESPAAD